MSIAGNLNKLVTEVIRRELLTDDLVTVIITVCVIFGLSDLNLNFNN